MISYRAIRKDQEWLEEMSSIYCPPRHCCPVCACPGYLARSNKQGRRLARRSQIEKKLGISYD